MAAKNVVSGSRAVHNVSLVAATEDVVTFNDDQSYVTVVNLDGTAAIYFTIDGSAATVAGDNTYVLPAAIGSLRLPTPGAGSPKVRLISTGTPKYSVVADD